MSLPRPKTSQIDYTLNGTGSVTRALRDKLGEVVSIEDFGVSTSNTAAQNSTNAQAALNWARANKRVLKVNGLYQIDTPLVLIGGNGDTDSNFAYLKGNGKTTTGFIKNTHTTHNNVDCILYVDMPSGATYGGNVVIEDLEIYGDIAGDQNTNLVAFGIYVPGQYTQLSINNCYVSADVAISFQDNLWQSYIGKVLMHPKSKGIEMVKSGTSNRFENCFVQSPQVAGYDLRGEYSSASALACDGATGWAYKFEWGSWDVSGLGSESTGVANGQVYAYNCRLTIRSARLFHPSADAAVLIFCDSGSNVTIDSISIANYTGNNTASGWFYNYGTSAALTIKNVEWDSSKRFAHKPAPNSSVSVTKENIFPMYGKMTQRENLILLAGAGLYAFDAEQGSPATNGAGIFAGGSDTNPASDSACKFDDGIPKGSIVINTRGTGNPKFWICTGTGSTISNCTFSPHMLEGTFTPIVEGTTTAGTATYSTQNGTFKQIGDMISFSITVAWSGHTGTGAMIIAGLPVAANGIHTPSIRTVNLTLPANSIIQGYVNGTQINLESQTVGGGGAPSLAVQASGTLTISGTYFTA